MLQMIIINTKPIGIYCKRGKLMSNYLTTKQRYNLSATEIPHNHNQATDGMVYMDVELVCNTTVGNLDSYSRNIEDKGVKEWLKSLRNGKKVSDISEI